MASCPSDGFCALPWLSWYDPYWWRHYDVADTGVSAIAPPSCAHPGPIDETRCCVNPLIGQTVLARRVEDGYYYLGQVRQEISRDRFLVLFDQASRGRARSANLQEVWVFDIIAFSEAFRHPIVIGDKVLFHVGDSRYSPATVLQGSEQRAGDCCIRNTDLLVSHVDGTVERLQQGVAIWIPPSLYDRLTFELKLPFAARRSLAEQQQLPDTVISCNAEGDCYADCSGWPVCGEECPHIATGNPYQCSNYYRTLYRSWPWWWKWWYQQLPPPWVSSRRYPPNFVPAALPPPPRPALQPLGVRRSKSVSAISHNPSSIIVCDDDYCYDDVEIIENDPLSRKVASQIAEHNRILINRRSVMEPTCRLQPTQPVEASTQTQLMKLIRQWRPPVRWMPTNKNQYGTNKPLNTNYVAQDRAIAEWEQRHPPVVVNYSNHCYYQPPKPVARPTTAYMTQAQYHHCHCGHC